MDIELIKAKDIQRVTVQFPKENDYYKWFEGQEEITEWSFFGGTKIIQEGISEGWSYSLNPKSNNHIITEEKINNGDLFRIIDGKCYELGNVSIHLKGDHPLQPVVYKSMDEEKIRSLYRLVHNKIEEVTVEILR